jgi:signal transduction histidine kinase
MTTRRNGLPIAAYLALLVLLALAAAFVAVMAIVIWLPPRPPDVVRADMVAGKFAAGYQHTRTTGRTLQQDGIVWSIRDRSPALRAESPHIQLTQLQLAGALSLRPDQVRLTADHIERSDTYVFRVAEAEDRRREAERIRRQIETATRERHRIQIESGEVKVAPEFDAEWEAELDAHIEAQVEEAMRTIRQFEYDWEPPEVPEPPESPEVGEPFEAPRAPEPPGTESVTVEPGQTTVVVRPRVPSQEEIRARVEAARQLAEAQRVARAERERARNERAKQRQPQPAPVPVPEPAPEVVFAPAPPGVALISGFEVGAQLPDGRWLVMSQGRNWAELGWIGRATLIIGGTLALVSILSLLFARRLTRPIRNFSEAVQAVGVDPQSEPVREEGPQELRGAARAINTMQARLRALIADRTKTLAAVAHDMRTPLMRLRLQAENVPNEQREKMAKEIGEVEALVASFIAFARDDPAEEARVRLDLSSLLQSIAYDHAEHGRDVTFEGEDRVIITGQSLGLKRLFANLVDNALKYATSARISLARDESAVIVDVQDDGPGIPADQRESVFEPFVRLNEEGTRGAGLGLAAAQSIARAHGGEIKILASEKGALLRVTLPG